jgi:hypothetical protein
MPTLTEVWKKITLLPLFNSYYLELSRLETKHKCVFKQWKCTYIIDWRQEEPELCGQSEHRVTVSQQCWILEQYLKNSQQHKQEGLEVVEKGRYTQLRTAMVI